MEGAHNFGCHDVDPETSAQWRKECYATEPRSGFAIKLTSKYTGDVVHLGVKYRTAVAAQKDAVRIVCSRCNHFSIYPVPDGHMWKNRHVGFAAAE